MSNSICKNITVAIATCLLQSYSYDYVMGDALISGSDIIISLAKHHFVDNSAYIAFKATANWLRPLFKTYRFRVRLIT